MAPFFFASSVDAPFKYVIVDLSFKKKPPPTIVLPSKTAIVSPLLCKLAWVIRFSSLLMLSGVNSLILCATFVFIKSISSVLQSITLYV